MVCFLLQLFIRHRYIKGHYNQKRDGARERNSPGTLHGLYEICVYFVLLDGVER